jgi:lactocepin
MAGNANYLYPELKNMPIVYNPNVGKQYTVKFNSQGGSSVSSKTAIYGNTITAPKSPTRSGYSFAGWYKESSCKNAWNFSKDTVTKDITLYAKWTYPLPGKPSISAKSASYNSIKISWKKTSRATKYQIYRATSKNGTYKKIGETSSVNYINKNVDTGKTYYYKVKAYYKKGSTVVYSSFSDVKSAKAVLGAPAKPKAKKASATSIKLGWSKVTGASGYEIVRCETKTGTYTLAATVKGGTKTSYTNVKLTKGKTYYYKIRAYRTVGGKKVYSGYSSIVSAKL